MTSARRHEVDAVPAPRLMQTIGATALAPTSAVAELVANSLDARLEGRHVRIEVRVNDVRIEVVDDARGMTLEVLREALRLGVDMDAHAATRNGRMGTYGLGMKTAAASLGDRWGLITRPVDASTPVEYRAEFDLRAWAKRGWSREAWTIALEETSPDTKGPLGEASHGTVIWIEALRTQHHLPGAYLLHLSKAFAPFLKKGNAVFVNGQEVAVPEPKFAEGTYHRFETVVDEARGWAVRGWVALDTKTHNDGMFGIDLYRNDQLIELRNKDFFKAHLMTSRIVGEAHLDFVPVNFNKVDFAKGTEEWAIAKRTLKELLKPVVEASRIMSRGRHDHSRNTKAVAKLNEAFAGPSSFVEAAADVGGQPAEQGASAAPVLGASPSERLRASGSTIWLPRGTVRLDAQIAAFDPPLTPWDYVPTADGREVLVVLNEESALYKKMKDSGFLACIAVADCIARFLIEREHVDPRKARRVSNEWLHEAVTGNASWVPDGDSWQGAATPS